MLFPTEKKIHYSKEDIFSLILNDPDRPCVTSAQNDIYFYF